MVEPFRLPIVLWYNNNKISEVNSLVLGIMGNILSPSLKGVTDELLSGQTIGRRCYICAIAQGSYGDCDPRYRCINCTNEVRVQDPRDLEHTSCLKHFLTVVKPSLEDITQYRVNHYAPGASTMRERSIAALLLSQVQTVLDDDSAKLMSRPLALTCSIEQAKASLKDATSMLDDNLAANDVLYVPWSIRDRSTRFESYRDLSKSRDPRLVRRFGESFFAKLWNNSSYATSDTILVRTWPLTQGPDVYEHSTPKGIVYTTVRDTYLYDDTGKLVTLSIPISECDSETASMTSWPEGAEI